MTYFSHANGFLSASISPHSEIILCPAKTRSVVDSPIPAEAVTIPQIFLLDVAFAMSVLYSSLPTVSLEADCELYPEDITMNQAKELYYLEPYGVSNPAPVFVIKGITLADVSAVGGGKHTRLTAKIGGGNVTVMFFRTTPSELDLYPGDCVDIMFGMDINEFMNQRSVQLVAKDIRLAEPAFLAEQREYALYELLTGEAEDVPLPTVLPTEQDLPERQDFAIVYSTLKRELKTEHEVFSLRALRHLLLRGGVDMPYHKLKAAVKIFGEMGLLRVDELDAERDIYAFGYIRVSEKADLEQSPRLRKMRENYKRIRSNE